MTRVAIVAVLAAVLDVDRLVLRGAEGRIAEQVAAEVGVDVRVDIDGRLAGLSVLRGRIGRLTLSAREVPLEQAVLDRLTVDLRDLRLDDDVPVAGVGTFEATLTQAQVRQAAPPLLGDLLSLGPEGASVGSGLLTVPLSLAVEGEDLLVSPDLDAGLADLLADLVPGLAEGIRVPLDPPEGVVVTFDQGRDVKRTEMYPEYKAGRAKAPDEFKEQLPLIEQVMDVLSIPVVKVPGVEADDVIATLAERAIADGW